MGMRLAGVEGEIVHNVQELHDWFDRLFADQDVAIILMTTKAINLDPALVYDAKLNRPAPLIVEIPDRSGTVDIAQIINRYISEAIGMKV